MRNHKISFIGLAMQILKSRFWQTLLVLTGASVNGSMAGFGISPNYQIIRGIFVFDRLYPLDYPYYGQDLTTEHFLQYQSSEGTTWTY